MQLPGPIGDSFAGHSELLAQVAEVLRAGVTRADLCAIQRRLSRGRSPRAQHTRWSENDPAERSEQVDAVEKQRGTSGAKLPRTDLGFADEVGAVTRQHVMKVVLCDHALTRGRVRNGDGERASGDLVGVCRVARLVEPVLVEKGSEGAFDRE